MKKYEKNLYFLVQFVGRNFEDFFKILIETHFQKSQNLIQILRIFYDNFVDRAKLWIEHD